MLEYGDTSLRLLFCPPHAFEPCLRTVSSALQVCPPQAFEPCLRTATGRRRWIVCCADFDNRYHHSHSALCFLISAQIGPLSPLIPSAIAPYVFVPLVSAPLECPANEFNMVRHRMRSRKGGTKGGSSHPLVECSTSSPFLKLHHPQAFEEGRHPSSKRGRGRARSSGVVLDEFDVHSDNSPPPLHPTPHSAHFRFCSSLNRPVITASISISFSEEIVHSISQVDLSNSRRKVLSDATIAGNLVTMCWLIVSSPPVVRTWVELCMVKGVALLPRALLVVRVTTVLLSRMLLATGATLTMVVECYTATPPWTWRMTGLAQSSRNPSPMTTTKITWPPGSRRWQTKFRQRRTEVSRLWLPWCLLSGSFWFLIILM